MIVGRYVGNVTSPYYTYSSPWKKFIDVSGDLVDDSLVKTENMSILANGTAHKDLGIFPFENTGTYKVLWENNEIEAGDGYTCIGLRAGFKTLLSSLGPAIGNFGLELIVTYYMPTTTAGQNSYRSVKFDLSNRDMYGDPYNFETYYH